MSTETQFCYTTLRYEHDIRTEEFLNVGILLWAKAGRPVFRYTENRTRLQNVFPGVDASEVIDALRELGRSLNEARRTAGADNLMEIAHTALPEDASSLKWSAISFGKTSDPVGASETIFREMVERYEKVKKKKVRTDDDLWTEFEVLLQGFKVVHHFHRTSVSSPLKSYRFDHAWRNECPHIIAPISLDAETREGVVSKATHWTGQVIDLARSSEEFTIDMILGRPSAIGFAEAYENAVDFLEGNASDSRMKVIREQDQTALAAKVASEITSHLL